MRGHNVLCATEWATAAMDELMNVFKEFERRLDAHVYMPPNRPPGLSVPPRFPQIDDVSVLLCVPGEGVIADVAVVFAHGNSTDLAHAAPTLQGWSDGHGVAVIGFDYPGYGETPGTPSEDSCCDALRRVLRWATGVWPRLVVVGFSLGTGVVAQVAADAAPLLRPDDDIILAAPFLSIIRIMLDVPEMSQLFDRFRSYQHVPKIPQRVSVVHGLEDELVSCAHGKELYGMCARPGELLLLAGVDHGSVIDTPEFHRLLRACATGRL